MRTDRVLCGAAVTAVVVSLLAACGDVPTAVEADTRAAAPRSMVAVSALRGDTSFVTANSTSADEQAADTSGVRRGGQMAGGGN